MKYEDLKVGQKVKIMGSFPSHCDGWENTWESSTMDEKIGRVVTVKSVRPQGVQFEESGLGWPWQILELVEDVATPPAPKKLTISLGEKYKTRDGREVVIYCVDAPGEFPVHGRVSTSETPRVWGLDGRFLLSGKDHHMDLIKAVPYADFKIDDPVIVWDEDKEPEGACRRHFAGVRANEVLAFQDGQTSWSSRGLKTSWSHCRRPTAEELNNVEA